MSMWKHALKSSYALIFLVGGCALGPDYERPSVSMPSSYALWPEGEGRPESYSASMWWEQFNDPILNALVDEAIAANYDVQIALAHIEIARGVVKVQTADLYPQIQRNFVAARSRRSANLESGDVIETTATDATILPNEFSGPLVESFFQFGFDMQWEIDLWGKGRRKRQAALYALEASEEHALGIEVSLVSDLVSHYIAMRTVEETIHLVREKIQEQKELVELSLSRTEGGMTAHFASLEQKMELQRLERELPPLESLLAMHLHALALLCGKAPEGFSIESGPLPSLDSNLPQHLPVSLLAQRPDIRFAEKKLAEATALMGAAKAHLFPTLSLEGNMGLQTNVLSTLFAWKSRYWTIGPGVIWTLFAGGRLFAQYQIAKGEVGVALLAYEQTILRALQEVEDHLVSYVQGEKELASAEAELQEQCELSSLMHAKWQAGLIAWDEVVVTEKKIHTLREIVLAIRSKTLQEWTFLCKSLGLGVSDLTHLKSSSACKS